MPTKKPTIASAVEDLQGRVETLDQEIARVRKMRPYDKLEQERITLHEERISRLETTTNSTSYGSIFATWLAVVVSVVGGMLIAHAYLAERYTAFYQGKTIDIGAHPGYDAIFWAAGIIAVIATTAVAIVAAYSATPPSSVVATSSTTRTSDASSGSSAVEETYVYTEETTPTEVTPVVRV